MLLCGMEDQPHQDTACLGWHAVNNPAVCLPPIWSNWRIFPPDHRHCCLKGGLLWETFGLAALILNAALSLTDSIFMSCTLFAYILKADKLAESVFFASKNWRKKCINCDKKCVNFTNPGFSTTNCQNKASLYKKCLYWKQSKDDKWMERHWCSVVLMVFAFSA